MTDKQKKKRRRHASSLSPYERETIIRFNEGEDTAYIFTCNRAWQQHLERRLGIKPVAGSGSLGREYQIAKDRIKPPRALKRLSLEEKRHIVRRLARGRKNSSGAAQLKFEGF